jgi:hypothetical protein
VRQINIWGFADETRVCISLLGIAMVGLSLWLAFAAFTWEAISHTRVLSPVAHPSLPSVAFSDSVFSVGEADGSATITVTLSAASEPTVTVDYATSDGTAKAGSDYRTTIGTITFATDETSGSIDVPTINDMLYEGDETVLLTLSDPNNATLGTPITATLTIVDDDPPTTVQFSRETYSTNEADASATITVTLSTTAELMVTVDYATSDGTARADSDYRTTIDTMTLATDETTGTFEVPILDDADYEGDETVLLTLSNPDNATLGTPITATLTIVDDDPPPLVYLPLVCREPFCLTAEKEPNNTASDADSNPPLCPDAALAGTLPSGDDNDVYRIEVAQAGTLVADLWDIPPGTDYDLFVYDKDRQKIGESREFGTEPEHIEVSVEPGKYYLRVNPYAGRSDQNYHLRWSLR